MIPARIIVLASAMLAGPIWAWGCGDGATEPAPPTADPPRPTTVTVSPATAQLSALQETVPLTAEVRDQYGQVMAGATVTWASSSSEAATVDTTGLVTAAGNGTATITATAGGASGSAAVTVAQTVSSVAVSPPADTLVAGDTVRLSAEAADANGHAVAGAEFAWASSDTLVAVVDSTGLAAGVRAGEAEVTATASGVAGRAQLVVKAPTPTTVAVRPDTVGFTALGQSIRLMAEVRDQAGRAMEGVAVSWSSADTLVAWVDSAGLVTASGAGATMVTAGAGEASGEAVVTVMQSAGSVVVTPPADTIGPGDTLRLVAEAYDENGHRVDEAVFTWSSSDASLASVDGSGLVTGVAEGVATITTAAGAARGTSEITVENPDRAALVALYHATDGPNWVNGDNWLTDAPLGDWYGVRVRGGRVVGLLLARNALTGPIPAALGSLSNLRELSLGENALTGLIPAALGSLSNLRELSLGGNALTGPIPAALGSLSNLTTLSLYSDHPTGPIPLGRNNLTGPIPPEFGGLSNLTDLHLWGNALTGPIPAELLELDELRSFQFDFNDGLCAPGIADFVTWLQKLDFVNGPFCNASDIAVLQSLYESAGGASWANSAGWRADAALGRWYGVSADSLGRVAALDLSRNNLAGRLPPNLGELAHMIELRIGGNALSGWLPLSLARLRLVEFHYAGTELCAPAESGFQAWLNAIASHDGTGVECAPLSDRDILVALYDASGGPNWTNVANWLTEAPLGDWDGVGVVDGRVTWLGLRGNNLTGALPPELGNLANLTSLDLANNKLSGAIPTELGSLANLRSLVLWRNALRGPIPPALSGLANLTDLNLSRNALTGPIPAALGDLANLTSLDLANNKLSGTIPAELGNLASLRSLVLWRNALRGPIPPALSGLANLTDLNLSGNALTGPIPPALGDLPKMTRLTIDGNALSGPIPGELGRLATLEELRLEFNGLVGPLPPELGGLTNLTVLSLTGNGGLSGALPAGLTELRRLEELQAGGTDLCAPEDPGFQAWLETVHKRWIATCEGASLAYLAQTVQSREFPVPLVAGEKALLRVFVTAARSTTAGIPPVRATFYLNGTERHLEEIPATATVIPTEVREGDLSGSANAEIPGEIVQPGLEVVIEIDPDGTLDPELGVVKRIPETGRLALDVRVMPVFGLTLIPFLWSMDPDSSVLYLAEGMETDPENHGLLWATRTLLPVGDLDVTAHEPVLSSSNNGYALHRETAAIRVMEGGTDHYMGMMSGSTTGPGGVAFLGGRTSLSTPSASIMAHELGHNMNLSHAPCGGADGPDPSFPYPAGSIGVWGYDFRDGGRLVSPRSPDLMSYCSTRWISDYHFTNALRYRLVDEGVPGAAVVAAPTRSILLWGGVNAEGEPFLEPAFVVDAPAAFPRGAHGEYEVTGSTAGDDELFSLRFAMPEATDGDGSSSFAFALPVRSGWESSLASITLASPGGSFTLSGDNDLPMAILRNPRTGQVRGILRDLPPPTQTSMDAAEHAAGTGLEVLFSRGIPDASAWRR